MRAWLKSPWPQGAWDDEGRRRRAKGTVFVARIARDETVSGPVSPKTP
jgi:hypothetical protein